MRDKNGPTKRLNDPLLLLAGVGGHEGNTISHSLVAIWGVHFGGGWHGREKGMGQGWRGRKYLVKTVIVGA